MKLDTRYSGKIIRHFAAQMRGNVAPEVLQQLEEMFANDQPDEFYAGLLSGLVSAEVLKNANQSHLTPLIIGFIADRLEKKEIV